MALVLMSLEGAYRIMHRLGWILNRGHGLS